MDPLLVLIVLPFIIRWLFKRTYFNSPQESHPESVMFGAVLCVVWVLVLIFGVL